ncbi:MAG: hypothetical protein ABIJ45_03490 [Candidatus Zixiibacteriota bacterium]
MFKAKFRLSLFIALLIVVIMAPYANSGDQEFEDIVISFEIPKLMQKDIIAQYDGKSLFLPLIEIISLLDIKVEKDFENGLFSGSYIGDDKFKINIPKQKAECQGRSVSFENEDYNLTPYECYIQFDLFKSIFDLKLYFDFSELKVHLPLDREFPAYQKLKRINDHAKLKEEKQSVKDIAELEFQREKLKGGVADWALTVNPFVKDGQFLSLNLGGMLLGGDMAINGSFNSTVGFASEQLRYKWHYIFNDNKFITQAEIGEVATFGGLSRNLEGVQVTNRPNSRRQYFKTVDVDGNIGPNWEVELYLNNKLIEFHHTDQSGDYHFSVDINYGTSRITLKMYGPNGEYEMREEYHQVPFNLIPKNNIEYSMAAGSRTTREGNKNYFQSSSYYGAFDWFTMGLSSEVPLQNKDAEKPIFAGEMTIKPFGNMLLNSIISPENEDIYSLSLSVPSLLSINASYSDYYENPIRNALNRQNSYSISISSPLKIWGEYFGLRYRITKDNFPEYSTTNMFYGMKLPIFKFLFNYMGGYKISDYSSHIDKYLTSQLLISNSWIKFIRPQVKIFYDHVLKDVTSYGIYVQKRIFKKGQLSLSFERNNITKSNQIMLTFNIFSNFANFTSRFYSTGNDFVFTQLQRGSIRFDQEDNTFRFTRRNGLGLGSAKISPYLDENFNGVLDDGEQLLPELKANIGGAFGTRKKAGELYYYDGLRPYDDYIVQIDPNSLDNPMYYPAHDNFRVAVNPNSVTNIMIPIVAGAEITGNVSRIVQETPMGVGGIKVMIENQKTEKIVSVITFNDGEYFKLGIVPGVYKAYLDKEQLAKYGYISDPPVINFQVNTIEGGDTIENLNFVIKANE